MSVEMDRRPVETATVGQTQPEKNDAAKGGEQSNWTVITASDAYTSNKPYVAQAGEHVRSIGSYVDAAFGSVVIGDHGGSVKAEQGSDVTVKDHTMAIGQPGSRITVGKDGEGLADGAKLTVKDGGWGSVGKGSSAEVEGGGRAILDDGAQGHLQAGASAEVKKGAKVSAEVGAKVRLDFGATVDAPKGTDVQTAVENSDLRIVNSGSVSEIPESSFDADISQRSAVAVAPYASLTLGGGNIAQAMKNSEVVAKLGSIVLAEDGSKVIAEPGSKVIAKPGADVQAQPGAVIAKADETVNFDNLLDYGLDHRGIAFHSKSHFVGDHQKADSDNDIIPPMGSDIKLYGDHNWVVPGNTGAVAMPGSRVTAAADGYVQAMEDSSVEALPGGRVDAERASNVIGDNHSWVTAKEGSFVDARNGSHLQAEKGANVLRHVETDIREDKGANIEWKATPGERLQFEATKLAWKMAPYATFLLSGGMASLRDSARYVSPSSDDYVDHFPQW